MPTSPQDLYAKLLLSSHPGYGYPLWTPEPSHELLMQRGPSNGLKIGDVGVVIPDNGGFDVLFNICQPQDHEFHRRHGVPEGFTFIDPNKLEIRTCTNAVNSGRTISTPSVKPIRTAGLSVDDAPQTDGSADQAYRFALSSTEGALLVLPSGAKEHHLLNEGLFVEQASQHGAKWYEYAVNRRHRVINHDSLYLITGFHKAHCWSVAAFESAMEDENHTARFKRVQGRGPGPTYSWETTCALDWRAGPDIEDGHANQAVFISGLKIALRPGILGSRRITVEADYPSTRPIHGKLSSIMPNDSRLLDSFSRSFKMDGGRSVSQTTAHNQGTADSLEVQPPQDASSRDAYDGMHVEIRRVPDVPAAFHPSDAINQYLFRKEPSANIAVTPDSVWMTILQEELLRVEEFERESRLEEVLSHHYHIISEEGVVRLERKSDPDALDDNEPEREQQRKSTVGDADERHLGNSRGPQWRHMIDSMERYLTRAGPGSDLSPSIPTPFSVEWVKLKLDSGSWKDVVSAAGTFSAPKFTIFRAICERLEVLDQTTDAIECFSQMRRELGAEGELPPGQAEWITEFKQRFAKKYEHRGDAAMAAQRYDEAISEYSAALSLQPVAPQELFIKRSTMYEVKDCWDDALNDAYKAIELDASSPWGYERKHAALHKAGEYGPAIVAFQTMLSKMADSPDPEIRKRGNDYLGPSATIEAIRLAVEEATKDLPRVLIHTESGRLCAKSDQMKSFQSQPVFKELISSMTTSIDSTRIKHEVTQYYRYATFSHKWEEHDSEPVFAKVMQVVVYALEQSPTHHKLQMFCKIVRDAGLHWAWSDTCCINKEDDVVLQEALVSMFKWYESSAETIVHLRDVHSTGRRGDLLKSIWNSRAWTLQEYHASKVVRFYTSDWKPYLNLGVPNHKLAPEIISEMEEATGVSAQTLMSLHPGTADIRDKLRLASGRQTTYIEDSAYSLLGIFSMSLPIIYGERDKALGKLLAQLLTTSGDTSILAWTGVSGSINSCLPESITVFDQPPTTHIPQAISHSDMEKKISSLRSLPFEAENLYMKLNQLPTPVFTEGRMKLPCLKFTLGPLCASWSERGYRAMATGLGPVEIYTQENLSRCEPLYLVHPWIDHLLGRSPSTKPSRRPHLVARLKMPLRRTAVLSPPLSAEERRTRMLQCMVRLKEPFGALLLTPKYPGTNTQDLKRVAADCRMTVRLPENVSLKVLMACVDVVDVL